MEYQFKQQFIGNTPVGMVNIMTKKGVMCILVPNLKKDKVEEYIKNPHVIKQVEMFESGDIKKGDKVNFNIKHDVGCGVLLGTKNCSCKPDYQILRLSK